MAYETLIEQWRSIVEELTTNTHDAERDAELWDRRKALWNEMRDRTDASPPTCPECGAQQWAQSFGDPKVCTTCDFHPTSEHEELIAEINDYWDTVLTASSNSQPAASPT